MAISLPERWGFINGHHEFDQFELPEIDGALLLSLLDETCNDEECEDERLLDVIRSLEAEIDPNYVMGGCDVPMTPNQLDGMLEEYQSSDCEEMIGQDCSTSQDLDFSWMDMEMTSSSPAVEMTGWYMDEIEGMAEFDGVIGEYSHMYYGVPLELEEHASYESVWQEERYNAVIYG